MVVVRAQKRKGGEKDDTYNVFFFYVYIWFQVV